VTSADATVDADNKVVIRDTSAAKRTALFYKVIATKGGKENVKFYDRNNNDLDGNQPYNTSPWSTGNVTYLSSGNGAASGSNITNSKSAATVTVNVDRFDPATVVTNCLYTGESIVVYYQRTDEPSGLVLGTTFTFAELTTTTTGQETKTFTVAEHGAYTYKVFVKVGDKLLEVN
jgi:hypothetical protein